MYKLGYIGAKGTIVLCTICMCNGAQINFLTGPGLTATLPGTTDTVAVAGNNSGTFNLVFGTPTTVNLDTATYMAKTTSFTTSTGLCSPPTTLTGCNSLFNVNIGTLLALTIQNLSTNETRNSSLTETTQLLLSPSSQGGLQHAFITFPSAPSSSSFFFSDGSNLIVQLIGQTSSTNLQNNTTASVPLQATFTLNGPNSNIPEPGTASLLLLGFGSVIWLSRRRSQVIERDSHQEI